MFGHVRPQTSVRSGLAGLGTAFTLRQYDEAIMTRENGSAGPGRPAYSDAQVDQRREQIFSATLELIIEVGADNVSLKQISKRAGISVGAIQHYFRKRDDLVRQALIEHSTNVVERLRAPKEASHWARVLHVMWSFVDYEKVPSRSLLWMELIAAGTRDPLLAREVRTVFDNWTTVLTEVVSDGVTAGEFRLAGRIDDVVAGLIALIDGFEAAVTIKGNELSVATVRRRLELHTRALLGPRD